MDLTDQILQLVRDGELSGIRLIDNQIADILDLSRMATNRELEQLKIAAELVSHPQADKKAA